ncbi:MAG: sulfurtransferase [Saprospiraceae bacterium]|nr:sulfurtransferase [Saprospiraceae bacterium]
MYTTLIGAEELKGLLDQADVCIVDCRHFLADLERGRTLYQDSHIPGAHFAHLDEDLSGEIIPGTTGRHPFPLLDDFLEKCRSWGIGPSTQVVAYDQGHGGIAARLWFLLHWIGHDRTAVLNGGWARWDRLQFPTSNKPATVSPQEFVPKLRAGLLVDAARLQQLQKEAGALVVDSRAAARYRGEEEPIDPIAGHIPGAISAPFAENLDGDGRFKSDEELRQRFDQLLGEQEISNTIFYCGSGVTACHNLLALHHLGHTDAKLYPGSWSDWITVENRPIATGAA